MKKIILIGFLFVSYAAFSQTKETIDRMDSSEQSCLDSGVYMLGCADTYYAEMDSMLNLVYKKLRMKCDSSQRAALKAEQLKWLSDRDKYFKKVRTQSFGDMTGQDKEMAITDKYAQFVRERVLVLIKRLN